MYNIFLLSRIVAPNVLDHIYICVNIIVLINDFELLLFLLHFLHKVFDIGVMNPTVDTIMADSWHNSFPHIAPHTPFHTRNFKSAA
jgi:hypothetical protein